METTPMRICPKCEFVDSPYWRHSRYNNWWDFMEWENFIQAYPIESRLLQEKMDFVHRKEKIAIEDKWYVYVKSRKSKYVYRMCKLDGSWMYSFHGLGEKPNSKVNQKKLLECEKKGDL